MVNEKKLLAEFAELEVWEGTELGKPVLPAYLTSAGKYVCRVHEWDPFNIMTHCELILNKLHDEIICNAICQATLTSLKTKKDTDDM